jgi:hypothetical protein
MSKVHSGLKAKEYVDSDYTVKKYYCTETGCIATNSCKSTAVGWYKKDNIPTTCATHKGDALPIPGSKEDKDRLEPESEDKKDEQKPAEDSSQAENTQGNNNSNE